MTKFVAYRIVTYSYNAETGRMEEGYFMKGQRASDLNWENIGSATSEESALETLRTIRANENKDMRWCPIYNPHGYSYEPYKPEGYEY